MVWDIWAVSNPFRVFGIVIFGSFQLGYGRASWRDIRREVSQNRCQTSPGGQLFEGERVRALAGTPGSFRDSGFPEISEAAIPKSRYGFAIFDMPSAFMREASVLA